jgi:predicted kinase
VLIQMSGAPGSGKSTVARELARSHRFVIVDHDVVKNAQLAAGLPFAQAGKVSYAVLLALAEDLLEQGHDVIIDSPCFYDELLSAGQGVAGRSGAPYRYIECVADDFGNIHGQTRSTAHSRASSASASLADSRTGASIVLILERCP